MFWIGYVWALPNTLLGCLVFLFGGRFERWESRAAIVVVPRYWPFTWWADHFTGMSLGGVILCANEVVSSAQGFLKHELRHFQQARRFGPLWLPLYLLCWLIALVMGRNAYADNFFEQDARQAESTLGSVR